MSEISKDQFSSFKRIQFSETKSELFWRVKESSVELGLFLNENLLANHSESSIKWVVLGVQSTQSDQMCSKMLAEWNESKPFRLYLLFISGRLIKS